MTGPAPLFSVLIATYERQHLLDEAIASVFAQTVTDLEVIVVDDVSPTPATIPDDPRIRLVRRTTNGGQGASYNTGLDHARGRYVVFLDDDDLLTPERLAIALEGLERAPVAICRTRVLDTPEQPGTSGRRLEGAVGDVIRDGMTPNLGQTAVERERALRFDERLRASADVEWWIRMAQTCTVATVDRVGLLFRRHDGVRHGNDQTGRIRAQRLMLEIHADWFAAHPRAAAFQWERIGRKAERMGDHRTAAAAYARSVCRRPTVRRLAHLGRAALRCVRPASRRHT